MKKILKYKKTVFVIFNIILVLCALLCLIFLNHDFMKLYAQQAGIRFSDKDTKYSQISVFMDADKRKVKSDLSAIRTSYVKSLRNEGYIDKDQSIGGDSDKNPFLDAYSLEKDLDIKRSGSTYSVTAVIVGGDYFTFHPLPLKEGSYFSEEDVDKHRIVIDENLAWMIFGSNDVSGMEVYIDNHIYTIAGISEVDKDDAYKYSAGSKNRIYIPFDTYEKDLKKPAQTSNSDSDTNNDSTNKGNEGYEVDDSLKITTYEALLPNPIQSYALNTVKTAFGVSTDSSDETTENMLSFDNIEIVDNSARYNFFVIMSNIEKMLYDRMKTNSLVYPFWENQGRYMEGRCAVVYCIVILLLICPVISLFVFIFKILPRKIKEAVLKVKNAKFMVKPYDPDADDEPSLITPIHEDTVWDNKDNSTEDTQEKVDKDSESDDKEAEIKTTEPDKKTTVIDTNESFDSEDD